MSRSGKTQAARDQRKRDKAKRRDARKARGVTRPPPARPAWDPLREGIEGYADRGRLDYWAAAAALARRADLPAGAWTLPRVDALSTEAVIAGLSARGVTVEEAPFRALGDEYRAASALLVYGLGAAEPPTALDRDFVRLAARVLYRRWVTRWACLEDIEDAWRAAVHAGSEPFLAASARVAEALALHLAAPGVTLAELMSGSSALHGWLVTVIDEAESADDPALARLALPALQLLTDHPLDEPYDRLDALRALAVVLIATGEAAEAERRLLDWSATRSSAEGAVALTEAWRAHEDDCAPELRRAALALLRAIPEKGWACPEDLSLAERIADLEGALGG